MRGAPASQARRAPAAARWAAHQCLPLAVARCLAPRAQHGSTPLVCVGALATAAAPSLPPCTADDPSGRWRQAQQAVADNPRASRLAAVGVLGAELLALAAACALQSIYQRAYEAWLDDREARCAVLRCAVLCCRRVTCGGLEGQIVFWMLRMHCCRKRMASHHYAGCCGARSPDGLAPRCPVRQRRSRRSALGRRWSRRWLKRTAAPAAAAGGGTAWNPL